MLDIIQKTLKSKSVTRPLWKVQAQWEVVSPTVVNVSNGGPKVKLVGLENGDCELNVADYMQYSWLREIVEYPLLNKRAHLVGMNVLDAARIVDKFMSWRRVFDVETVLTERVKDYANMPRKEKVRHFVIRRIEKTLNEFVLASVDTSVFKIYRRNLELFLGYDVDPKNVSEGNKTWQKALAMVKEAGLRLLSSYAELALDVEKYRSGEIRE
jgi:hypothetical protein